MLTAGPGGLTYHQVTPSGSALPNPQPNIYGTLVQPINAAWPETVPTDSLGTWSFEQNNARHLLELQLEVFKDDPEKVEQLKDELTALTGTELGDGGA